MCQADSNCALLVLMYKELTVTYDTCWLIMRSISQIKRGNVEKVFTGKSMFDVQDWTGSQEAVHLCLLVDNTFQSEEGWVMKSVKIMVRILFVKQLVLSSWSQKQRKYYLENDLKVLFTQAISPLFISNIRCFNPLYLRSSSYNI